MVKSIHQTSALRHFSGSDPSQFADLHLPTGERRAHTVVLLHGGWWGPQYGADNQDGVAAGLAERGCVAWNIEYRRLELGGGYPSTSEDVAAAIDHLATVEDLTVDRVVALGHSAGGHLAAWAAGRSKLAAGALVLGLWSRSPASSASLESSTSPQQLARGSVTGQPSTSWAVAPTNAPSCVRWPTPYPRRPSQPSCAASTPKPTIEFPSQRA